MEMERPRERRERKGELGKGKRGRKGERGKEKQGEEVEHNGRTLLKFSKKKNFISFQDYPPLKNLFFFTYTNNKGIFNLFCYKDHSH